MNSGPAYTRLPDGTARSFARGVVKLRLGETEFPVHHDLLYDGSKVYREAVDSTGGSPCAVLDIPATFSRVHVEFFLCVLYKVDPSAQDFEPDAQLEFFKFIDPSPWVYELADTHLRTHSFFYECEEFTPRARDYLRTLVLLDRDFRTTLPQTFLSAKTSMQKAALCWGPDFFSVFASRDLLGQLHPETIIDVWHATMWSFVDLDTAYARPDAALTATDLRDRLDAMAWRTVPLEKPGIVHGSASLPFRFMVPRFAFTVQEARTVMCLGSDTMTHTGGEFMCFKNPGLEILLDKNELTVWFCGDYFGFGHSYDPSQRHKNGRLCPAYLKGRVQYPWLSGEEIITLRNWTHCVQLLYGQPGNVHFEGEILLMRH